MSTMETDTTDDRVKARQVLDLFALVVDNKSKLTEDEIKDFISFLKQFGRNPLNSSCFKLKDLDVLFKMILYIQLQNLKSTTPVKSTPKSTNSSPSCTSKSSKSSKSLKSSQNHTKNHTKNQLVKNSSHQKHNITIISRHLTQIRVPDTEVIDIYIIVGNALLLNHDLLYGWRGTDYIKTILIDYGTANDPTSDIPIGRVLFLLTFDKDHRYSDKVVTQISQIIIFKINGYYDRFFKSSSPKDVEFQLRNDNVISSFIELMKCEFNMCHYYPETATPNLARTLKTLMRIVGQVGYKPQYSKILEYTCNTLLSLTVEATREVAPDMKSNWTVIYMLERRSSIKFILTLIDFLYASLPTIEEINKYNEENNDDIDGLNIPSLDSTSNSNIVEEKQKILNPLLSLFYNISKYLWSTESMDISKEDKQTVDVMKQLLRKNLLPKNNSNNNLKPVPTSSTTTTINNDVTSIHSSSSIPASISAFDDDTLAQILLKLTTSFLSFTNRDIICELLFQLCNRKAKEFVKAIGFEYASGYLVSHNIPLPTDNDDDDDEDSNEKGNGNGNRNGSTNDHCASAANLFGLGGTSIPSHHSGRKNSIVGNDFEQLINPLTGQYLTPSPMNSRNGSASTQSIRRSLSGNFLRSGSSSGLSSGSSGINFINGRSGSLGDDSTIKGHYPQESMTMEEKEQEAEKLFVLFERLRSNGTINVENPVRTALESGKLEDLEIEETEDESKNESIESKNESIESKNESKIENEKAESKENNESITIIEDKKK